MEKHQLVIVGFGAAGIASSLSALKNGIKDILVLEVEKEYGGILEQCIHNGFGLHTFNEELSGPAYAEKYYALLKDYDGIKVCYESTVIKIENKILTVQNKEGIKEIEAEAIIITTGSRERPYGAIGLKGDRPAGVYCAGTAQKYLNKEGYLVGKKVFILGSGDIGLIMARRMTLEGAKVIGVAEIMPYSNGLARNIKQCLEDFNIPLYLSHTVKKLHGKKRLEKITLVEVDKNLMEIPNSSKEIECDCLLLSIGLIPENSLIENLIEFDSLSKGPKVDDYYQTSADGIFCAGNALHVHDLVDYVSLEASRAGKYASDYILNKSEDSKVIKNNLKGGISYIVPQVFHINNDQEFLFRVNKVFKECDIHIYGKHFDKTIKKLGIVPSEMQKVTLKKEDLIDLEEELYWEVI